MITIREVPPTNLEELIPLLVLAEPSERALRWGLAHLSDAAYRVEDEAGALVGAVSMQWRGDPCEIEELAVAPARQGQGIGKQIVAWIVEEARRRGKHAVLVGTPNASIGNIAFYQKCGFRMDQIRHDYFRYYREPLFDHGIQIRDMLVFRYNLIVQPQSTQR
ncbi:MAG TPA: GNAT family N-acetyltransferase [Roseiflexaceae bacterium]|jgi:GNAT superfamily N-acetyltransferase|nr:GNAT family N-acetyltransferase [Roseiflexaceae bacterium]